MPKEFDHDIACILLINGQGDIIAQRRDDKPGIQAPGKISCFGGFLEEGETPRQAIERELHEETNLELPAEHIEPFCEVTTGTEVRFRHTVFIAKGISTDGLEVYEGQGFTVLDDAHNPLMIESLQFAAEKWFAERERLLRATASQPAVHRYAAAFFVGPDGTLYGQLRDDKPGIDQPGKIGAFGGACEEGETPLQTLVRELHEETDRTWRPEQLELFSRYVVWRPLTREYEQANIYLARNIDPAGMRIHEGQGIAPILAPDDRVAVSVLPAVRKWFAGS